MPLVFLYGTLKRTGRAAHLLDGQRFISAARTAPRYRMYRHGWYPCLVEVARGRGDSRSIEGELWEVDDACILRLDEFEGVGEGLYRRQAIELEDAPAGEVQAYFYCGSVEGMEDCGSVWT